MKVTIPLRQQEFKLKIVKTVLHKNNNASSKTISPHCDGWIQHDDGNKENRSMANKKTNPFPFWNLTFLCQLWSMELLINCCHFTEIWQ